MTDKSLDVIMEVFSIRNLSRLIAASMLFSVGLTLLFVLATDYPTDDIPLVGGIMFFLTLVSGQLALIVRDFVVRFIFRKYRRIFHLHEYVVAQLDTDTVKDIERKSRLYYWALQASIGLLAFGGSIVVNVVLPSLGYAALPDIIMNIGSMAFAVGLGAHLGFFAAVYSTCNTFDKKISGDTAADIAKPPGWVEWLHRGMAELAARTNPAATTTQNP